MTRKPRPEGFKLRCFADLHLRERPDVPDWLEYQRQTMAELIDKQPPRGQPEVVAAVFLGDFVHDHGVTTPAVAQTARDILKLFDDGYEGYGSWLIPGNHDFHRRRAGENGHLHAMSAFASDLRCAKVVSEPCVETFTTYCHPGIPYIRLAFLPWRQRYEENADVWLERVAAEFGNEPWHLFSHVAVQGGSANASGFEPGGVPRDFFRRKGLRSVILGDFHRHQIVQEQTADQPAILYVGPPMEHDWGMAGGPAPGALDVFFHIDGRIELSHVLVVSPRLHEVVSTAEGGWKGEAARLKAQGHFVRVIPANETQAKEALEAGLSVDFTPPERPQAAKLPISPESPALEILDAYLASPSAETPDAMRADVRELAEALVEQVGETLSQTTTAPLQILHLRAENWMTHAKLDVALANRGLVLIEGADEDDPSAEGSGAGKSAILHALVFGLFGKPVNDAPLDKLRSRFAKSKRFLVQVELLIGPLKVQVTRSKNCSEHASGLEVLLDGQPIERSGNPTQTQAELERLLGYSRDSFMRCLFFGQGSSQAFAACKDSERKSILDSLLGGDRFGALREQAKLWQQDAEKALSLLQFDAEKAQGELTRAERALQEANEQFARLEEQRQRDLEAAKKALQDAKARQDGQEAAQAKHKASRDEALQRRVHSLQGIQEAQAMLPALAEAEKEQGAASAALIAAQSAERIALKALNETRMRLSATESHQCPLCSSELSEETVERVQDAAMARHLETLKAQTALSGDCIRADQKVRDLSIWRQKLSEAQQALRVAEADESRAQAALEALQSHGAATGALRSAQAALQAVQMRENPWQKLKETRQGDLPPAKTKLAKTQEEIAQLEQDLQPTREVVRLFGNQGLKAFLFDAIAPRLSDLANDALATLSAGTIRVSLRSESKKSGEKLAFLAEHVSGADFFEGLSAGQRQKVNFALAWAFFDLAGRRAGLFLVDEFADHLDAKGAALAVDLMGRRAKEIGTVLVISHKAALKERVRQVWTVRKRAGVSTLEEGESL